MRRLFTDNDRIMKRKERGRRKWWLIFEILSQHLKGETEEKDISDGFRTTKQECNTSIRRFDQVV
jgi:tryptophanyl-tRNA synthetase